MESQKSFSFHSSVASFSGRLVASSSFLRFVYWFTFSYELFNVIQSESQEGNFINVREVLTRYCDVKIWVCMCVTWRIEKQILLFDNSDFSRNMSWILRTWVPGFVRLTSEFFYKYFQFSCNVLSHKRNDFVGIAGNSLKILCKILFNLTFVDFKNSLWNEDLKSLTLTSQNINNGFETSSASCK